MASQSPWKNEEFAKISLEGVDRKFLPGTSQEVDFLERELGMSPGDRVLDIGCGAGRHTIELARRGYQVVGVDISLTMLAAAKERAADAGVKVQLRQMDIAELGKQFPEEGTFDAAICLCESGLGVLGSEKQDLAFLGTVRRLLKSGGSFAITTLNALRQYRNPGAVFDYTTGVVHWQAPVGDTVLREDQRVYAPSELRLMVLASGFTDAKIYGCSPGSFCGQELQIDDIEMMLVAKRES